MSGFTTIDLNFKAKEARKNYEEEFCKIYLRNLIGSNSEQIITDIIEKLKKDNKEAGMLSRIAYEQFNLPVDVNNNTIKWLNEDKFWLYRVHISVDNIINEFNANYKNDAKLVLLNEFIKKMDKLEFLKYLPPIIQMINVLYSIFNRQINRQRAETMKIGDLLTLDDMFINNNSKDIIHAGCNAFLSAWNGFKRFIKTKKHKYLIINSFNLNRINNEDIPLSYLLPSDIKDGRYIHALVVDLIDLQNEILRFYINRKNERLTERNNHADGNEANLVLKEIELNEVKSSSCIKFTIDIDILRIVHMHCNYSLGSPNVLNIEFLKIQSSIEERILNDKPRINNKVFVFLMILISYLKYLKNKIKNIPRFEFCDDLNDSAQLIKLEKIVQQV